MKAAMFVFVTGLLTTLGGVGGIEHSVVDSELYSALLVAGVGLAIMLAGAKMINRSKEDILG
jgi:hypothetical protein